MKTIKLRALALLMLIAVTSAITLTTVRAAKLTGIQNSPQPVIGKAEDEFLNDTALQVDLLQSSGKITFLRVHDVGTGYGPSSDFIDGEVVIKLNTEGNKMAFGFQLRNDANSLVHQAMLDLMRDAYMNDWTVTIDYQRPRGKNHGDIIRVWLSK
jgi:hypothetical protein